MIAPWLAEYSGDVFGNPMVSIGIVTIIGCISSIFMKETYNVATIDEIEEEIVEQ